MEYTEREKKAIENVKIILNSNIRNQFLDDEADNIEILLNLLEKQQKEIEKLKEHLNQYYDGKLFTSNQLRRIEKEHNKYYIHKDKIREKIEEYAGLKEIDIKAYDEQIRPLKEILGE